MEEAFSSLRSLLECGTKSCRELKKSASLKNLKKRENLLTEAKKTLSTEPDELSGSYSNCFRAFASFCNVKFYFLAILQGLSTFNVSCVDKKILAAVVWRDETEAFLSVKEFNFASFACITHE
jgi:hypothetical protein